MPFPEFEPGRKKLLVFSRGRGRGHAIPDIEIVRRVVASCPSVDVRFVSYGRGARTIEQFGWPLIDLQLPEANGTAETTVLAGKLIGWLRPDLVVAHEEFAALPASSIFDIPAVCVTDWFTGIEKFPAQALRFAEHILFLERRNVFPEPVTARGKTSYIGPVVRTFEYSRNHRARAREELGIASEAVVVTVLPGSWTEEQAPLAGLVPEAIARLRARAPHLIWLAGDDHRLIRRRTRGLRSVTVLETEWHVDRLMAASDVAVTKGSRGVGVELAALGIRTVAISHGLNDMDDRRTNALNAAALTPPKLARILDAALAQPPPRPRRFTGAQKAAAWIVQRIEACTGRS